MDAGLRAESSGVCVCSSKPASTKVLSSCPTTDLVPKSVFSGPGESLQRA